MSKERIVFMGTPDFAVATLKALLDAGANVVGVITAPDRPAGRGMKLQPSAVKQFAVENELNVLQPTNLKSEEFLNELRTLKATLQVVVAFRMLPEVVWNMPEKGTFNLHASLLPQYRGAAPINWAVINGEKESGVTTFFLQQQIDTGNIIFQEKVAIGENETAGELHDKLMTVGAGLVVKTLEAIENGNAPSIPQNMTVGELQEAPKIFKETCKIDWNKTVDEVFNHVRGLSPYPTAFTSLVSGDEEIGLKVFEARKTEKGEKEKRKEEGDNGTIQVESQRMFVKCADGWLEILELQMAGKKRMETTAFLLGFNVSEYICE
ncbi:MAG: methionyl-tRNA formyltransferase [Flavobacteriales bacterium]|nr:methionyl-tRNA formyltransferase [Flavobacteriales bacterium]